MIMIKTTIIYQCKDSHALVVSLDDHHFGGNTANTKKYNFLINSRNKSNSKQYSILLASYKNGKPNV